MDNKRFDLSLGDWGPYTKRYLGLCHIADKERGITFNVEFFPGFYKRSVVTGHTYCDDGVRMWGAEPGLSRFVYRYETEFSGKFICHKKETEIIVCLNENKNYVFNSEAKKITNGAYAVKLKKGINEIKAECI